MPHRKHPPVTLRCRNHQLGLDDRSSEHSFKKNRFFDLQILMLTVSCHSQCDHQNLPTATIVPSLAGSALFLCGQLLNFGDSLSLSLSPSPLRMFKFKWLILKGFTMMIRLIVVMDAHIHGQRIWIPNPQCHHSFDVL